MASKNKKFNVKHMGGNVDRNESEQVTKDYEVRSFVRFIVSSRFVLDWISDIRYYFKKRERLTFFSYSLSLSTVFCHRNTSKSKTTPSAREITPTS